MKRVMILVDYVLQFALRGFIVGAVFSSVVFVAFMIGTVVMAGEILPPHWWLIIPGGTLFGTLMGASIGFIDGVLVGMIASAFLATCKALSSAVASIATFGLLMLTFYIVAMPSDLFSPLTVLLALPVIVPVLVVAAVTGWDIADDNEKSRKPQKAAAA